MRKAKLALLAFLSTVITVGGVYATWTFAEGGVANATTQVNVGMTGVNATTEKGTLSVKVMGTGGFSLAVDDANNDHKPDIKKEGVVTVTFTPSANASDDIKEHGIDVQCIISYAPYTGGPATLEEWKYPVGTGVQMFNIINTASAPIELPRGEATNNNGVFTWTIPAADVGITLTDDFMATTIDTLAEYTAVNDELSKGHFVLTVSEYTTSSNP